MVANQKIKVAQVITRLDWGGSPEIFRILASRLDPAMYDITLVVGQTLYPTKKTREFLRSFKGRTVIVPSLKRDVDIGADIAAFMKLYGLFRREKFDIIHTHTAKAGALGRLAAYCARGSVIVHTPHGHNFYGYFGSKASGVIVGIERFLSRITDGIIALTQLEKADYLKLGVCPQEKVDVICQGLEIDEETRDYKEISDLRRALSLGADDIVIGMVGRLEPVKGSTFFIDAAATVLKKFPDVKFLVAGEGSLRQAMEKKAEDLGIGKSVFFTGWRDDVPVIMSILDIMVMPSLNEAVGMVIIEAQAHGVPVIATRVGGIPEILVDGQTGILVPPSDVSAIARAVIGLLSDEEGRVRMGAKGRDRVKARFKAEDMVGRISDLYMRLLHNKHF